MNDDELLKKFNEAKEHALKNPEKQAKGGCKSCKKKKTEITEFEPLQLVDTYVPDYPEIQEAFLLMQERNVTKEMHTKINKVYKALLNEDLPFGCSGCGQKHFRKFKHYIENVLGLKYN
jgi:hypothetical protein